MPPKRLPLDAYLFWALEHSNKLDPRTKVQKKLADLQNDPEMIQRWRNMPPAARDVYHEHAKAAEAWEKSKYTNTGELMTDVEARKKEKQWAEERMIDDVERTVMTAYHTNHLELLPFYFIHVNYLYSRPTAGPNDAEDFIPIEMAICRYTIKDGCTESYHQLMPVRIQMGYASAAKDHSAVTHKLEALLTGQFRDYKEIEGDYQVILEKFMKFLEQASAGGNLPPIFTRKNCVEPVKCFFDRLAYQMADPQWKGSTMLPEIYDIEILFARLLIFCDDSLEYYPFVAARALAEGLLNCGSYNYAPGIDCYVHNQVEEGTVHCSLATVRKWCYHISDYCCLRFNVPMKQFSHRPPTMSEQMEALSNVVGAVDMRKKRVFSTIKSPTGVTEAYIDARNSRTLAQEETRRRAKPLLIIDHSKVPQHLLKSPSPSTSADSSGSTFSPMSPEHFPALGQGTPTTSRYMRLRASPVSPLAQPSASNTDNVIPIINNDEFPPLGAPRKGRRGRGNERS